MFLLFSFLYLPCKFCFFHELGPLINVKISKFCNCKNCFPGPNLTCDPIIENDFERRIVWCKNREDPINTLKMAEV